MLPATTPKTCAHILTREEAIFDIVTLIILIRLSTQIYETNVKLTYLSSS